MYTYCIWDCLDSNAFNFDSNVNVMMAAVLKEYLVVLILLPLILIYANTSDGSCIPVINGCMDIIYGIMIL